MDYVILSVWRRAYGVDYFQKSFIFEWWKMKKLSFVDVESDIDPDDNEINYLNYEPEWVTEVINDSVKSFFWHKLDIVLR